MSTTEQPKQSDIVAFEALSCLSSRYDSIDKNVTYRDVLESKHAWDTVYRYYDKSENSPRDKEWIEIFYKHHYPLVQEEYVNRLAALAGSVKLMDKYSSYELINAVAQLQNELNMCPIALSKDYWVKLLDLFQGLEKQEILADTLLDPELVKQTKYFKRVLRTPGRRIEYPGPPYIDGKTRDIGTSSLRKEHDLLFWAAFDINSLISELSPTTWEISSRQENNELFNAVSIHEFYSLLPGTDGSCLVNELLERIQHSTFADITYSGTRPMYHDIIRSHFGDEDLTDQVTAKLVAHFLLAHVIAGIHTRRNAIASELFGEFLPRLKRTLKDYTGCNRRFVQDLVDTLGDEVSRQLPFGMLFQLYDCIIADKASVSYSEIKHWISAEQSVLLLTEGRQSSLIAVNERAATEILVNIESPFAFAHFSAYGLLEGSSNLTNRDNLSVRKSPSGSSLELAPAFTEAEREDPIVKQVLSMGQRRSFEVAYEEYRQLSRPRDFFEDKISATSSLLMRMIGANGIGAPSVLKRLQAYGYPSIMRDIILMRVILALSSKHRTARELARMMGGHNPDNLDERGGVASAMKRLGITKDIRLDPSRSKVLKDKDLEWIDSHRL